MTPIRMTPRELRKAMKDHATMTDKTSRAIVEAYCETCGKLWSSASAGVQGKSHAERHMHRVRVTVTVIKVYEWSKENTKEK